MFKKKKKNLENQVWIRTQLCKEQSVQFSSFVEYSMTD